MFVINISIRLETSSKRVIKFEENVELKKYMKKNFFLHLSSYHWDRQICTNCDGFSAVEPAQIHGLIWEVGILISEPRRQIDGNYYGKAFRSIGGSIVSFWTSKCGQRENKGVWITQSHNCWNGCFRTYLHRFQLEDHASSPICRLMHEDVEQVFFHCLPFAEERKTLQAVLCHQFAFETITEEMHASETTWNIVVDSAAPVIRDLRRTEEARRVQPIA